MNFRETPLSGLWEITTVARGDQRGQLTRLFCDEEFNAIRPDVRFVQTNHSITANRGTVRGMHMQNAPAQECKLIRCIRGAVFDVAVDLRRESPTFGQWHAVELNDRNHAQFFIPEGFAHGFQSLTDDAQLLYQHTASYTPAAECGIRHDDPSIAIAWPLPVSIVSERDSNLPLLSVSVFA